MSTEQSRSLDRFVRAIEKRARTARTISVTITIGTIVLGALTLFFTVREIRQQIKLQQANLADVTQKVAQAQDELARLQKEYELKVQESIISRTALNELPTSQRDALLQKAEAINRSVSSDSPLIFLQILDNKQRDEANGVSAMLKKNGFRVQGVEWVRVTVSLKQTEVKYFRHEYADEAQQIVNLLRQSGVLATPVAMNASTGQIEVWFSPDAFLASQQVLKQSSTDPTPGNANRTIIDLRSALANSGPQANQATRKLQNMIAELEKDKEAVPFLKDANISSANLNGTELVNGLVTLRKNVQAAKPTSHDLLNRINAVIVKFGSQ